MQKYKLQEVSMTQWRDPRESVLPYRGGSNFSFSPKALESSYVPVYKYPIKTPTPPGGSEDEASDSDNDDVTKDERRF